MPRELDVPRCPVIEKQGRAARRCTRDAGHDGPHVYGSWCLYQDWVPPAKPAAKEGA